VTKLLTALIIALGVLVGAPATAHADCDDTFTDKIGESGGNFGGTQNCEEEEDGVVDPAIGGSYVPNGPPPPVYEDYTNPGVKRERSTAGWSRCHVHGCHHHL